MGIGGFWFESEDWTQEESDKSRPIPKIGNARLDYLVTDIKAKQGTVKKLESELENTNKELEQKVMEAAATLGDFLAEFPEKLKKVKKEDAYYRIKITDATKWYYKELHPWQKKFYEHRKHWCPDSSERYGDYGNFHYIHDWFYYFVSPDGIERSRFSDEIKAEGADFITKNVKNFIVDYIFAEPREIYIGGSSRETEPIESLGHIISLVKKSIEEIESDGGILFVL